MFKRLRNRLPATRSGTSWSEWTHEETVRADEALAVINLAIQLGVPENTTVRVAVIKLRGYEWI